MFKQLHFKSWMLALILIIGGGNLTVSAETSTVNASKVSSASASWTGTANETWTVTVNGGATGQNVTNSYAQIGTRNSPSNSITFSTSGITGTITKIVIDCASYSGLGTVTATVGDSDFGTQSQSIPAWLSNSGKEVTFSGSASGKIVVKMTNGSGGRAMYIKSISVTYSAASVSDPIVTVAQTDVEVPRGGGDGTINVNFLNFSEVVAGVAFYEADGTTAAEYSWINADIDDDNNIYYVVDANDGEARTAYMKVYALDDDANEIYSDLITIIQQKAVVISDGVIDFGNFSEEFNYGEICTHTTVATGDHTWTAGNVTFALSGRHALYQNSQLRLYKANGDDAAGQITITAGNEPITSVVLETGDRDNITTSGYSNGTWTGNAQSVVLTVSDRTDINKITVTYGAIAETVTVSTAGWATFAPSQAVEFDPSVMSAFIVTGATTTSATLTAVSSVPAGTPVLVCAKPGPYTLAGASTTPAAVTGNKLLVSDGTIKGDESTIYALGVQQNKEVGFMLVADGVEIPAGKCYLQITTSGARSFLSLGGGEETAIKSVATDVNEGTVYDLQGRRVNGVKQGLYIVNGKKVVLK